MRYTLAIAKGVKKMIIIDIDMPKKCQWDCPFCASDGGACLAADVKTSDVERPSDCPLREITDADVKKHIAPRMLTVIPCELYEEIKSRWGASDKPSVMHCKDCKHHEAEPLNFCNLHGIVMSADDFCSYAESEVKE